MTQTICSVFDELFTSKTFWIFRTMKGVNSTLYITRLTLCTVLKSLVRYLSLLTKIAINFENTLEND